LLLENIDKQETREKIVLLFIDNYILVHIQKRKKKTPDFRSVTMHSSTCVQYFASMYWSKH
jgi:hypothetical protein